jgi:hypothetical protein
VDSVLEKLTAVLASPMPGASSSATASQP